MYAVTDAPGIGMLTVGTLVADAITGTVFSILSKKHRIVNMRDWKRTMFCVPWIQRRICSQRHDAGVSVHPQIFQKQDEPGRGDDISMLRFWTDFAGNIEKYARNRHL